MSGLTLLSERHEMRVSLVSRIVTHTVARHSASGVFTAEEIKRIIERYFCQGVIIHIEEEFAIAICIGFNIRDIRPDMNSIERHVLETAVVRVIKQQAFAGNQLAGDVEMIVDRQRT